MSDLEECIHGMIGPCSYCLAPERKRQEQIEDAYQPFTTKGNGVIKAKFLGKCEEPIGCGDRIEVGNWIARIGEEWYHEECGLTAPTNADQ